MTKKNCFVICPIGSEGSSERKRADQLLRYIIERSIEEYDYTVLRADQIGKPGIITTQIIDNLINADLVIADLYGHNPNVFYELGIRHAIRKPVVQIYHPNQLIPFDVAGLRSIRLDINDLDSVEKCIEELKQQITAIEEKPEEITSPFSITIDFQTLRSSNTSMENILARILESIEHLRSEIVHPSSIIQEWEETSLNDLKNRYSQFRWELHNLQDQQSRAEAELKQIETEPKKTQKQKKRQEILRKRITLCEEKLLKLQLEMEKLGELIKSKMQFII